MKKTRSNALWNKLSPEQLRILDKWLFEEKLGYLEVLAKAQNELGFKGSKEKAAWSGIITAGAMKGR